MHIYIHLFFVDIIMHTLPASDALKYAYVPSYVCVLCIVFFDSDILIEFTSSFGWWSRVRAKVRANSCNVLYIKYSQWHLVVYIYINMFFTIYIYLPLANDKMTWLSSLWLMVMVVNSYICLEQ